MKTRTAHRRQNGSERGLEYQSSVLKCNHLIDLLRRSQNPRQVALDGLIGRHFGKRSQNRHAGNNAALSVEKWYGNFTEVLLRNRPERPAPLPILDHLLLEQCNRISGLSGGGPTKRSFQLLPTKAPSKTTPGATLCDGPLRPGSGAETNMGSSEGRTERDHNHVIIIPVSRYNQTDYL